MAETVPYKIYKTQNPGTFANPKEATSYSILPGYNTPYSYQETDLADYETNASERDLTANKSFYDQLKAGSSPYVKDPTTGNLTTQSTLDTAASLANNPNMKNIGTPEAPKYVPGNSPGAANAINFGTQNTANQANTAIKQAFEQTKASGVKSPDSLGEANSVTGNAIKSVTAGQPPDTSTIDAQLAEDKGYQQLLADYAEFNNTLNQGTSLVDEYNKMVKSSGLESINTELINTKNIIEGTEDDIRLEVQAANGFATDSQVMALASARNKSLIKNYNKLVDQQTNLSNQLNTMVNLKSQDRQFALQSISQKMQINEQINNYRDKFVQNAREGYKNIIAAIGYDGLFSSLANDPKSLALAERTLGLGAGQLNELATTITAKKNLEELKDYSVTTPYVLLPSGSVRNTQTGKDYGSQEEFIQDTGMDTAQAGAKGLLKPLGMTKADLKDERGYELDVAKFGLEQDKFQFEIDKYNFEADQPEIEFQTFEAPDGSKRTFRVDKKTGDPIDEVFGEERAVAEQKELDDLIYKLTNKNTEANALLNHAGLSAAVGSTGFGRFLGSTFGKSGGLKSFQQDFVGRLASLTSQETLDGIIKLKAAAGGIGTLSDQDIRILQDASTAINNWARKDGNGNITHYEAGTGSVKRELSKLIGAYNRLMEQATGLKKSDIQDMDDIVGFNSAGNAKKSTPYLKTLGTITGIDGSPVWKYGLDVDLKKGDPVKSPVSGKVIASAFEKGFGNTVKIQDSTGQVWRLSHLDQRIKAGGTIKAGQVIGLGGNTGTVIKGKGGDGSHLDITVYRNGKPIAAREVKKLLDKITV